MWFADNLLLFLSVQALPVVFRFSTDLCMLQNTGAVTRHCQNHSTSLDSATATRLTLRSILLFPSSARSFILIHLQKSPRQTQLTRKCAGVINSTGGMKYKFQWQIKPRTWDGPISSQTALWFFKAPVLFPFTVSSSGFFFTAACCLHVSCTSHYIPLGSSYPPTHRPAQPLHHLLIYPRIPFRCQFCPILFLKTYQYHLSI